VDDLSGNPPGERTKARPILKAKPLLSKARTARRSAYAPYSRFRVGAALLTASGKVFTGCNVENASYGLTICAERSAVFTAVAAGERRFKAIAIAATAKGIVRPCGACLQVLAEFAPRMRVIILNGRTIEEFLLSDLLPERFRLKK
jgi:cytidine deaminase